MSYKMSDSLARATGAVYSRAWRQIIYAAVVFAAAYIGQFQGLPGVATGVCCALVINFFLMADLGIRITGITWSDLFESHQHGLILGSFTAVQGFILVSLFRQLNLPHWITLAATILLLALSVALILRFQSQLFIRADQKKLIDKLILKRFKKLLIQPV
jgi:PST family polysaccharide transporter